VLEGRVNYMRAILNQLVVVALLPILFSVVPQVQAAQTTRAMGVQKEALKFAREFYGWYVAVSGEDRKGPAWEYALKHRSGVFSTPLANALGEDLNAQSKAEGEIVGIDFDPFLNTQDPGDRYEVRGCEKRGEHYFVNIYRVRPGGLGQRPDVIAELYRAGGKWQFVDFHYPEGGRLLRILHVLRLDRDKR